MQQLFCLLHRDDTLNNYITLLSIRILVTSDDSGLIETVKNSISIHSIKKEAYIRKWNKEGAVFSLQNYFQRVRDEQIDYTHKLYLTTYLFLEMGFTRITQL